MLSDDKPTSPLSTGRSSPTSDQGVQAGSPVASHERSGQKLDDALDFVCLC